MVKPIIEIDESHQMAHKFPRSFSPSRKVMVTVSIVKGYHSVDIGKAVFNQVKQRHFRIADKWIWLHKSEFERLLELAPEITESLSEIQEEIVTTEDENPPGT